MSPLAFLAAALLAATAAQAKAGKEVRETHCAWLVQAPDGVTSSVDLPELHLMESAALPGPLAVKPPAGATAVQCGRTSIVPAENDDEMLALGLPLYIIEVGGPEPIRLGSLEISSGRFRYRLLEGQLTETEGKAVSRRLNRFQTRSRAPR